jgi:hypothetical protein
MKSLAQLNIARLPLLKNEPPQAEDERVLELFRNRAELKKAYSELQDEVHALKDRLKQQEGVTASVQEMLRELEQRLEAPDTAYPVLVFYALHRLWNTGNQLLAQYASELADQLAAAETKIYFVECNRRRFERRRELDAAMQAARGNQVEAEQRLAALESQRAALTRPWHYFKRKDLEASIVIASAAVQAARGSLEPARAAFAQFEQEAQAPFPGLSVGARRKVNIATIAFAEVLAMRLARTPLMGLAKAASLRRSCGDEYGTRTECEALLEDIGRAHAILAQKAPTTAELQPRMEHLRSLARYRSDEDCIPLPESLQPPASEPELDLDINPLGKPRAKSPAEPPPPNVLADDTWDLVRVLTR